MVEVGLESRSPDASLKELVSTFLLTISQISVLSVYCVRAAQELPAEMGPALRGWPWGHLRNSSVLPFACSAQQGHPGGDRGIHGLAGSRAPGGA